MKKVLKKIIPDRLIRLYRESKMLPEYIHAIINDRNKGYPELKFYTDEETVDKIIGENMSLSRFGDGEIKWMCHQHLNSFQDYSDELADRLRNAYLSTNPKLLIGIPYGIVDSTRCTWGGRMHWRAIKREFFEAIQKVGALDRVFCNASITRPYIDYIDREYSAHCFENLRRIWDKRDVIFVEGNKTKLGMGNDLFDNAKSIRRIVCPAENAFFSIDKIKEAIRNNASKSDLLLVALGPTATILSSEMCDEGYHIIDIGHIDVEYIWFLRRDILRNPIEGKYVNESGDKGTSSKYEDDPRYYESIIERII